MFRYIITVRDRTILSFLVDMDSGKTVEIHAEPAACGPDDASLRTGDILNVRVENLLPGIGAAFVKGSAAQPSCYLPLEDVKETFFTRKGSRQELQPGDELLVQVRREAMKGKAPAVTSEISIRGRYVLLSANRPGIRVSKKMQAGRREACRLLGETWIREAQEHLPRCGVLFRSLCEDASDRLIRAELDELGRVLIKAVEAAPFRLPGTVLYREPEPFIERVHHYSRDGVEEILTDDVRLFAQLREAARADWPACRLYEDPGVSLNVLYSLDHRLREALERKVFLSSGAFIVIDPTEAMTVIDVNTGKDVPSMKKKEREEAFLRTNLLAAEEIAHQLRLRNLSGIVMIDFINMEREESAMQVMHCLEKLLREDPVPSVVVDMTKLGLVEVTRKKTGPPLAALSDRANPS